MPYINWKESANQLRKAHQDGNVPAVGLLVSEIGLRWKDNAIGDFVVCPIRCEMTSYIAPGLFVTDCEPMPVGGKGRQITYKEPSSKLFALIPKNRKERELFLELMAGNIGPAISSIFSFAMRCLVVAYNDFSPPFISKGGFPDIIHSGKEWADIWTKSFRYFEGLRKGISNYHPLPQKETELIATTAKIYEKIMRLEEKDYYSFMGAMRLYQMAHAVGREDESLAYALLVAAIDSLSSQVKTEGKGKDVKQEIKIEKCLEKAGLDENTIIAVMNLIAQSKGVKQVFCDFIISNLPSTFWDGDYSYTKEVEETTEGDVSGQYYRDLSENLPEPEKAIILEFAERLERHFEEIKRKKGVDSSQSTLNERTKAKLGYFRAHFRTVLSDTYDCRSDLFHRGRSFPNKALESSFSDWLPELFEEDLFEFIEKHSGHRWKYLVNEKTGRIVRQCSCGNKKTIRKMLLGLGVFDIIVHDSILNYLLNF